MFNRLLFRVCRHGVRLFSDEVAVKAPALSGERGVNRVHLMGRVGRDAELRGVENHVALFPLATSQSYKKEDGTYKQFTDWHKVAVFRNQLKEYVATAIKKGDKVFVSGSIKYREYTNSEHQTVQFAQIVADEVVMVQKALPKASQEFTQNEELEEENKGTEDVYHKQ